MLHSSESDSDVPEAISLKMAKKSSKAQDKLVQVRNSQVAKLAKDKNRTRDARVKAAKEATNSRSTVSDPSSEKNGGKTRQRAMRKSGALPEDDRIAVGPNGEEDDLTPKRIRIPIESAMHDAESEGTENPGLSDANAEGLDGDFAFGEDDSIADEDGEQEDISVGDEEMKDPEEWTGIGALGGASPARKRNGGEESLSSEYGVTSSNPDYLPDELFAQAAAGITARVQKPTDSKTKEVKRKKSRRQKVRSKDLIIGSRTVQVIKPLNPAIMASYTIPSKPAQRFVKQHLKGGYTTRGWERRPVNVGSLSVRGGPANGFRRV